QFAASDPDHGITDIPYRGGGYPHFCQSIAYSSVCGINFRIFGQPETHTQYNITVFAFMFEKTFPIAELAFFRLKSFRLKGFQIKGGEAVKGIFYLGPISTDILHGGSTNCAGDE